MGRKGTDNNDANDQDEVKENVKKEKMQYKVQNTKNSSFRQIIGTTFHNLAKGFEEFQETMDNSIINSGTVKYAEKYDLSNYTICEATNCRQVFQDLVLDLPESLYSHMPNRYLWAMDAHL